MNDPASDLPRAEADAAGAEAAFPGLLQGLTEFLPVSSSAHLRIVGPLLPSAGILQPT